MKYDSFAGSTTRHGTASGWSKHKSLAEPPCPACYAAKAEYDHRWRSSPERTRKSRAAAMAQARAYRRLAALNPGLYRLFYEQAKRDIEAESNAEETA